MKSFIFNIKTYKMKKILIALFLIFHITCFSQNGTDNYYSGEWTPMAAKGYKFKYLRSDSGASIRAKLFVYDSTFLKGRAYANVLPATSDSSSQIANTEWVKKVIKDLGIYNIESDHVSGSGCIYIDSIAAHTYRIRIDSACFKATYGVTLSKRSDSVFVTQHGVETFAFLDASGGGGGGSGITALTGDVTASGTGSVATTLATVNSSPGTYTNATLTVNGKGLITSASSGTTPGLNAVLTQDSTSTKSIKLNTAAAVTKGTMTFFGDSWTVGYQLPDAS